MSKILSPIFVTALLALSACTTEVETNPARTATEELLISKAAEQAADRLASQVVFKDKVFVDNSNFEGTDSKYAIGAIRAGLLKHGVHLVDDKKDADAIIETRSGALSTDRDTFLIGIPQFAVPVPFASGPLTIPEIALYSSEDQKGVAKFAATGYDAKNGTLIVASDPQYGFSHNTKKTVMIFVSWTENDALPQGIEDQGDDKTVATKATPHAEYPLKH